LIGFVTLAGLYGAASASFPTQRPNPEAAKQKARYAAPKVNPGDWPTYGHDVSRTGFNPDETTISASNVNDLVQRWQANLGGGSSPSSGAPSVSNGKVFAGSSIATGNNFFAYDAVEGGRLWGANLHYNGCFSLGIGATSAISGTIVSVGGGDSAFYGLNTETGEIVWRNAMDLGSSAFPWASPLLAYDRSYLGMASCADNPSVRGEVRAVDMFFGTPVASVTFVPTANRGAGVWNSPALSPDGSIMAVATGEDYGGYNGPYNRAIVALDPITLQILGSDQRGATGGDQDFGTTPVIFHDNQSRVLVGANHKNGTFYAYVLNNVSAGPIWQRSTGTAVGMMPAYDPTFGDGGTLFIAGGSRIMAVDPATGLDRWPLVTVGTMHGNMALANGLIFVNVSGTGLRILNESNGAVLRTIVPTGTGTSYSGVAVSNGFIYWLSGANLNAWSLPANPNATETPTRTPSDTPTETAVVQPTNTPTGASTETPTGVPTGTPILTSTPVGSTDTATPQAGTGTPATFTSTPVLTSTPCSVSFTDVHPSDFFYVAVQYLACRGVISGYSDGTFRPFNNTTRGQLTKIVVLAEGWTQACTSQTFSDVPPSHTFYCYVETAVAHGVISGYADGTFRPGNDVTRGQLSKIVVLAEGWTLECANQHFVDVPPSNPFYCYVETAFAHGIISGYADGTFRPGNNATRGQISKIVYQAVTGP
jgi:hypothetical protein